MIESLGSLPIALVITPIVAMTILAMTSFASLSQSTQNAESIKEIFYASFGLIIALMFIGLGLLYAVRYLF
jgi:hypothetical protein